MMKKTGRAMRLDINHRRSKILTLSKGTSASALSRKYVRTYKNQSQSPLTGPASLEMLKPPTSCRNLNGHHGKSNVGRRSPRRKQSDRGSGRQPVFPVQRGPQRIFPAEQGTQRMPVEGYGELLRH